MISSYNSRLVVLTGHLGSRIHFSGYRVYQDLGRMVSNSVVTPIRVRWAIHASVAAALFAVPYRYWLMTPVLQYVSIGHWRLLAILCAAAFGAALSLVRICTTALSFGAIAGLLISGGLAAWEAPHDVAIPLYGAFASHVESFWRELLILTTAATLPAVCHEYFRKRRVNAR